MSPKETRVLSKQTKMVYLIERFMVETFEDPGYIVYLRNISPSTLTLLTVQESHYITFRLTKDFPWSKKSISSLKRKYSDQEDAPRKKLKVDTPELQSQLESLPNDYLEPLEPQY